MLYVFCGNKEFWVDLNYDIILSIYQISFYGNIINKENGKILKGHIDKKGYVQVMLKTVEKRIKKYRIHVLVANTFLKFQKSEINNTVNHKNVKSKKDKINNNVNNLKWVSNAANNKHAKENGLIHKGEECHNSIFSNKEIHKICQMLQHEYSYSEIIKELKLNDNKNIRASLYRIRKRISWAHISKNYFWNDSYSSNGKRKLKSYKKINEMKELILRNYSFNDICRILLIRNNSNNRDIYRNIKDGNAYID